ncbi:hypothetical protein Tco_1123339 [Tanacetum coccineum]|uniref:Uncharacterized protein n=1 Tax=Tanacetum coccineum TaxID=301880 RepID=A0ABQ5J353_9ASTR
MRIEQYFLMTAYALWEVIINGYSPPPKRTVDDVEQTYPPTTTEEKLAMKNELKARGTLLMALPNEHQLKFSTYKCAKTLMEAIEKSSEGLDQTYDRLKKLISQLEILGETISQKDMNLKFLRSLPSEWKSHTLIWRNKHDLDILSMDDLYNNLKIYETEVKGSSSSNQNSQNVAFMSSNNSGSSNQAHGSNSANTNSMSDALIYYFFVNQSNSLQLDTEDLQQIDADDLEEMDLKWQMAMLTMRARRFLNKTRRKINDNGSETIGRTYKSLVVQNGLGDQADEGPTNFALMAYTSLGSSSSSSSDSKNEIVFEEDIKILKLDIKLKDNALTEIQKKFEKVEKERDDLKLTLENFKNSSKNLSKLLDSQVCDKFKTGVGFDSQVVDSPSILIVRKNDRITNNESVTSIPDVATSKAKTSVSKPKYVSEPLIKDWISDNVAMIMRLNYEEINGGFVAFGGDPKGGKITSKGKICTGNQTNSNEGTRKMMQVQAGRRKYLSESIRGRRKEWDQNIQRMKIRMKVAKYRGAKINQEQDEKIVYTDDEELVSEADIEQFTTTVPVSPIQLDKRFITIIIQLEQIKYRYTFSKPQTRRMQRV